MKVIKLVLILLIIIGFSFSFNPKKSEAFVQEKNITIKTFPSSSFINAGNMAPGDKISSSLTMQSDSSQGIEATMHSRLQSGFKPFYSQLQLTVSVDDQIFYKGSLSKFQGYKVSNVTHKGKEIRFTVTLPNETGNQFQNRSIVVAFDFLGGAPLVNGNRNNLPDTATNTFNQLTLGAIFVFIGWMLFFYQRKWKAKKTI